MEDVRDFYDRSYRECRDDRSRCIHSLHDYAKAARRVAAVARAFGLREGMRCAQVLDVGCGLGYYTKALSSAGALVTGLDFSETAIEVARAGFPECTFRQGKWADDVEETAQFDVIWVVNFSLINTFDVSVIQECLIQPALRRLKSGGALVIGWNSNFSGRAIDGYSHWSLGMLKKLKNGCGLSRPLVPECRTLWLSRAMIHLAHWVGRSIPIFMVVRKD